MVSKCICVRVGGGGGVWTQSEMEGEDDARKKKLVCKSTKFLINYS